MPSLKSKKAKEKEKTHTKEGYLKSKNPPIDTMKEENENPKM